MVFGKKKRLRRMSSDRANLLVHGFRPEERPIPQKRLKIALGLLVVALNAYIIHSHRLFETARSGDWEHWAPVVSTSFVVLLLSWGFWVYISRFQREAVASVKRFVLVATLVTGTVAAARVLTLVRPSETVTLSYLIPVSFSALTLTIVFNQRFGFFSTAYMVALAGLVLYNPGWPMPPVDASFTPMSFPKYTVVPWPGGLPVLIVLAGGAAFACFAVGRIRDRSKLIKVGAGVGLVNALLIIAVETSAGRDFYAVEKLAFMSQDPLFGLVSGLMLGFLVSGALPFIEHFFEVTTDISLMELSDHNHPLLRRLLLAAPGTYHHSFITGTLAESAAESIGANTLLARVGGYFHDIGKISKPEYFTENESQKGSHHNRLTPMMSTLIIVAHTKDGIELARDYNLPPVIIDFIPQHHGTSVIEYFYREAVDRAKGAVEIPRDHFRYTGPKPQTKEAAIVSIADSVEAASRSLVDPTPARLQNLVHNILTQKLMDEQLDECNLTFVELKRIEDTFVRVLAGIFHGRIAYPEPLKRMNPEEDKAAQAARA